tara:strand:+ start:154 stop:300 length:147 start_codon:yes stop_codon:yes gene_type:complete
MIEVVAAIIKVRISIFVAKGKKINLITFLRNMNFLEEKLKTMKPWKKP